MKDNRIRDRLRKKLAEKERAASTYMALGEEEGYEAVERADAGSEQAGSSQGHQGQRYKPKIDECSPYDGKNKEKTNVGISWN